MESWGAWLRQNFDKLLLFVTWVLSVGFVLHLMHHNSDVANISWGREAAGTILGAFLTLITGSRLLNNQQSHVKDPQATSTVTITQESGDKHP